MNDFDAVNFERRVSNALQNVKAVLDNTRNPQLPKDVAHTYDDKYTLAELAVKSGTASILNVLELVAGLDGTQLGILKKWSEDKTVTLALSATETCEFVKTTERNEESATSYVTERTGFLAGTSTSKVVTKITEHFWKFTVEWKVAAYPGTGADESLTLVSRVGKCELMTRGKEKVRPAPEKRIVPVCTLDVSWLMANVTIDGLADFSINRGQADCHTPRRNKQTDEALGFLSQLRNFAENTLQYFAGLMGKEKGLNPPPSESKSLLSPVLAMFVFEAGGESPTPSGADFAKFLAEHLRQVGLHKEEIAKVFPGAEQEDKLNTVAEMSLVFGLEQCLKLCNDCSSALATVEAMLRQQVVAAIGKEVGPSDLTQYMEYHCRQLLQEEFQPKGFCYAIRRPDHYPEGTLSIEYDRGTAKEKDGQALVRTVVHSSGECEPSLTGGGGPAVQPMKFALDAATTVTFSGERHLHACVLHQFSGRGGGCATPLRLLARARQFSSFILLVGKIASADLFEPTAALIVRDKDDLEIPLMLETMPTPKEFKDAIESLSPEQQRFCKAFRAMQLASTLFGVCIIQIKPQLERLLNLPPDSLTKEIQLTNDLMEIFTKYQIPSDLISFDGSPDSSTASKLVVVKEHVAALMATIAKAKDKELADERQEAAKANAYLMESMQARLRSVPQVEMASFGAPSLPPPAPSGMAPMMSMSRSAPPPAMDVMMRSAPPPPAMDVMMRQSAAVVPTPAPAPTSSSSTSSPQQPQQQQMEQPLNTHTGAGGGSGLGANAVDYTQIPALLDTKCGALDKDNALRPTTIKTGQTWKKSYQRGLLSKPVGCSLGSEQQDDEKKKAFDLLDALSRSGVLSIESASLHVILAATHCFDKAMMDTIVQDNVNPIEPVERSLLIVAGVVHGKATQDMLQPSQIDRIAQFAPQLLTDAEETTSQPSEERND